MSKKSIYPKIKIPPLLHRKEQWTLTAQGWVVTLLSILILMEIFVTNIHPFLAVSDPLKADIMVIEGWVPDYAVEQAVADFKTGSYRKIIATGIVLPKGFYLAQYKNFGELTAATLMTLGLKKEQVIAVPAPNVIKDRTYASAVAVREWIATSNLEVGAINLYGFGAHTRRSWMLFKKALSPKIQVGAIAVESQDYDPKSWWKSSEGVRTVISEASAYIYARFFDWSK